MHQGLGRLLSAFILTTFLLLRCTLVSSVTEHMLSAIEIQEGLPANTVVLDVFSTFSTTASIVISIEGNNHPRVFEMYFQHSNGRITTTRVIDRDAMAVELQRRHLPVSFEIGIHALDFVSVVETVMVNLTILDINDNVPMFPESLVHLSLSEGLPSINEEANRFLPLAIDNDEGNNTVHSYILSQQNNTEGIFQLEVRLDLQGFISDLRLVQTLPLNREQRSNYILTIVATEGNSNPASATLVVNITVLDVCDQPPQFMVSRYFTYVEENSLERTVILPNITAMDSDLMPIIRYRIRDLCSHQTENTPPCVAVPEERSPFTLDRESGDLSITRELDREEFAQYEITILAVDDCGSTGTATVAVTVINVNDNAPIGRIIGTGDIIEGPTTAFTVYFLGITDRDDGPQSDESLFTFELFDNSTGTLMETSLFEMQTTPPLQLRVVEPLDREAAAGYMLVLNVTDWGTPNMSTILQLPINVVDINDHSPIFEAIQDMYMITENIPLSQAIVTLRATDRDAVGSGNGRITYLLPPRNTSYPHQEMFAVDQLGRLTASTVLDREELDNLFVLVEARDNPNSANSVHRSDFVVVNMTLLDMNDNIPLILTPPETVNISESQITNVVVFTVTASDNDTEPYSTLTFSLIPEDVPFQINPTTGAVILVSSLDHEVRTNYTLEVTASDVSQTGRRMVTVFVENVNDERCVFDRNGPYMSSIHENRASDIRVVDINASDRDTAPQLLRYNIEAGNEMGHFRINSGSGEIFTTQSLDHDMIRNYTLRVSCSDGSEFPSETMVFLEVLDINDNIPQFVGLPYNFMVNENSHEGTVVNRVQAVDADSSHNGAVRYQILGVTPAGAEPWFRLNDITGEINTTQSLDREDPILANDQVILNVKAFDQPTSGEDQLFDTALVYIQILDINDKNPEFSRDNVTFRLPENYEVGRDFPRPIHAVDADAPPHNEIEYVISGLSPIEERSLFRIIGNTGVLRLTTTLDFETNEEHSFQVQAIDTDERNRQAMQKVIVIVENVAENNVTFVDFVTEINVVENSPFNHIVTAFTVTDINETPLLVNLPSLSYSILNQNGSIPTDFAIRSDPANSQLIVYVSGNIDRESPSVGNTETVTRVFNITASDPDTSDQSHGSTSAILRVTIVDENDNDPTFGQTSYTFDVVEEGTDLSIPIGHVTATDQDFGNNGTQGIIYHIPDSIPFEISANGEIRPTQRLDREAVSRYDFAVVATDGGADAMSSSSVMVRVNILDINDNQPQFDVSQTRIFPVGEQESVDTIVAVLRVSDNDTGIFGQVNISVGDVVSPHFRLEPNGSIVLILSLDREASDLHFFTAVARDGGGLSTTADVDILVEDFNDNPPIFNRSVRTIKIPEDTQERDDFALVTAEDADVGNNGMVRYVIGNYSLQSIFWINPTSGQISLLPQHPACSQYVDIIDYERNSEYDVNIVAYDLGFPRHIVNKTIKIVVRPVNEHPPLFDSNFIIAYVNETQRSGVEVMQIRAVDGDRNDQISYEVLENGTTSSVFRYDQSREAVVNTGVLDYNTKALHMLVITAQDSGDLVGSTQVLVGVRNINNHAPVFTPEAFPVAPSQPMVISENTPIFTEVWTVRAIDEDNATHDAVSYFLEGSEGGFSIDSLTGDISVSASLDFEVRQTYSLQAFARDTGSPQMTSTIPVSLMIEIKNENDQSPIFNSTRYTFLFHEKQPEGSVVGHVYAPDGDIGSFGDVRYSIPGANEYFDIDRVSGEITTRMLIDRDAIASEGTSPVSFQFRVLATDSAPGLAVRTAIADVIVMVVDVNDNPPEFDSPRYLFRISPTHALSGALGTLQVSDRDEEANSAYRYEIFSEGGSEGVPLTISSSGRLSLERTVPTAYQPVYIYTVHAIDMGDASLRSSARVELIIETSNDHHPRFNPLSSTWSISEITAEGETVFRLMDIVSDEDSGINGQLSYQFATTYPKFQIDEMTGVISLREALDYEGTRSYNLTVLAMDGRPGTRRTATGTITFTVEPGNEYTPQFMGMQSQLTLSHLPVGDLELFTMAAVDRDDGTDGEIRYNLFDDSHLFEIGRETGILKNRLLIAQDNIYNLTVGAFDLGNPFKSSNTTILITIRNSVDTAPLFVGENPRTIVQPETDSIDGFLNTALFTNPQAETYHIVLQTVSGQTTPINMFAILEEEGRLSTLEPLDHEQTTEYSIVIESRVEVVSGSSVERVSDFLQVTLSVTDVNDNLPLFSAVEDQSFAESTLTGTSLFRVHAIDADSGLEGRVSYTIIQGNNEGTFSINSTSGEVFLSQLLDRETVSEYDLAIRARDLSNDPQSSQITVHVTVTDINDFETTYNGRNFSLGVYEFPHTVSGDRIVKLAAIDEDEGPPLMYTMDLVRASSVGRPVDITASPFSMHPDTGLITATQTLDREAVDHYLLRVTASDRSHTAETYLSITILDVNDHAPVMTVPGEIDIWEGQSAGTLVTDQVRVTDGDIGVNAWVLFSLGDGWPEGNYFTIDPLSGVIRTSDIIVAREDDLRFAGTIIAEDQGPGKHRVTQTLFFSIVDVNDHPPLFGSESIELSLSVTAQINTPIHNFEVTDADFGVNSSPVMFSIPSYYAEVRRNFAIVPASGLLTLQEEQSQVRSYNFRIDASNPAPIPRCAEYDQASSIYVTINVRPVNTHCPEFTETTYTVHAVEETLFTGSLGRVSSFDPDGDMVTYSLLNASNLPFAIHRLTGQISLTASLDRESMGTYSLTVLATDDGFPPMSCSAEVLVNVLDINDHNPVFDMESYAGSLVENLAVNSPVLQVHATDQDLGDSGRVHYELRQANVPFSINRTTGYITTTQSLDYDTLPFGQYAFAIVASDNGDPRPLSASVDVTITVEDVNEHPPRFITTPTEPIEVGADRVRGNQIFAVRANDSDRGAELFYSFAEPEPFCYFNLDNRTGAIELKVSPNACSTCVDTLPRRSSPDPHYFIIDTTLRVSDGVNSDNVSVSFMIHDSFCVSVPTTSILPVEIIAASITVVLTIVLILVCIFVFACICRARRTSKIRINDTTQSIECKRFGSGRSSTANTPAPIYKQTSINANALPHEHNTMSITGGSGTSSTRQSYGTDMDTDQKDRISYPSPSTISRKSQLSKPYRSTPDLGSSTMATDMLSGESQETAPYPKAQIEKIYAKNADLLNHSDSNESMHMFGSEGGGESDGGDDMLFAKFNDLDDDDDSTTMHDDDRSYQERSLTNSRDNLSVPPVMDDPYAFDHPPLWAPRINDMADTIDEMAIGSYKADQEHMHRGAGGGQHYMNDFNKSQEGVSMYGTASTQESTRPLLRHAHPQSRIPPHLMMQAGPEFYPYEDAPADVRSRDPKYGKPMYPAHGGHPMVRHGGAASQEVPVPYGYHRDFLHHQSMHHEMGVVNHSPSSSSTPTEGTLNTRAMTNEYESDLMYSSDTSINTNTEDPPHMRGYSQPSHSQGDARPPHIRGYSQHGHSQGDAPPHIQGYSQQGHSQGDGGPPHMRGLGERHPYH